jgi:DNA polymerase I
LELSLGLTFQKEQVINAQNIPPEAQKVFVPAPGHAFVGGDFSNLELRVAAFDFNDPVLQKMFDEGANIHDLNTQVMFGITRDHPNWKSIRRAAKIFVFGRIYAGGIRGIFERVAAEAPEVNLTMAQFRTADRKFFDAHPALAKGFEEAARTARETRMCITATGRKRFFLGTPDECEREGINTRIQSVAADIESESLIDLYKECQKHDDWKLVATVHDSNVIECRIEEVKLCASVMKRVMEKPRHLWGKDVVFPADISVSTKSWGELEPLEDWLKAQKPATKRPRNTHHPKA